MSIAVLGAGAFGTALAISLCDQGPVILWARDPALAHAMHTQRKNATRLPDVSFPEDLIVTHNLSDVKNCDCLLLCVPMQKLRGFLETYSDAFQGKTLVACCKGMELKTGQSPMDILAALCPDTRHALLTGPSFAQDIAKGLPTALTLACASAELGEDLQTNLSTRALRLYRTTDVIGAALGGAMKNVIAIACGAAMGAGLGESARAALLTRGNAEMQRLATQKGGDAQTLSGLSGFGDLVLTCTSTQSRNYRFGLAIGARSDFDPLITVEGAATARAVATYARETGLDLPISSMVAALVENRLDVHEAITTLLSRPLKEE